MEVQAQTEGKKKIDQWRYKVLVLSSDLKLTLSKVTFIKNKKFHCLVSSIFRPHLLHFLDAFSFLIFFTLSHLVASSFLPHCISAPSSLFWFLVGLVAHFFYLLIHHKFRLARPQTRSSLVRSVQPDHHRVFLRTRPGLGLRNSTRGDFRPDLGLGVSPVSPGP